MTKRDQTTRAWIARSGAAHRWRSHVSHRGSLSIRETDTHLRKAALEFNVLHTIQILTATQPPTQSELQTELFP